MDKILEGFLEFGRVIGIIVTHKIVVTTFTAWMVASFVKVLVHFGSHKRFDFTLLVDTGRMPSSHSAFVSSLATAIGLEAGWTSPVFMLALGFSLLVMNDAAGVRRAAGYQARLLNRVVDDMYHKKPFRPERLKELLGHTRLEVAAGMGIGVAWALLLSI